MKPRPGTVAQVDGRGRAHVVPWTESVTENVDYRKLDKIEKDGVTYYVGGLKQVEMEVAAFPQAPHIRRTPAERIESLFLRYHNQALATQARTGTYDLPREMFNEMQLECWKEGIPLSADALRSMVSRALERADRKHSVAGGKRMATEPYHHQGVIEVRG